MSKVEAQDSPQAIVKKALAMKVKHRKAPIADAFKSEYEKDMEPVRGRFYNLHYRGKDNMRPDLNFSYRKWGTDILKFSMKEGELYEVPRCVADHVNNLCMRLDTHLVNSSGQPIKSVNPIKLYAFVKE